MSKIGFIGLGIMGKPMAKNLLKAGYELVVFNRSQAAMDELAAAGAALGKNGKDVAEQCEIIFTMLPNSPNVRDAVLLPGGILEGMRKGSILVDMSSIAPLVSKEICAQVEAQGAEMLDAPVSGGEPKAIDGSLSIMVGGKEEVFLRVKPLLEVLGSSAVLCGEIGAGNTTKLVNQIIVALNIAAVSEGLVLGKKAGVRPEIIHEAIRKGLAGSTVLDAKAPMMMDGNFNPGFRIGLHIKDLNNILETGHEVGAPLPLTAQVMEMMQWLRANGKDGEDHSAVVQYYEAMAGENIRR